MTRPWREVSARLGRNDLPAALAIAQWDLDGEGVEPVDPADLPYAVVSSWGMCEWPEQALPQRMWLALYEEAGASPDSLQYIHEEVDEDETVERATLMDRGNVDDVTLYRGCTPERMYGMSWTEREHTARWFARRFGDGCQVYRATIPSDFLLAYITGRQEAEWVVHPDAWEMVEPEPI